MRVLRWTRLTRRLDCRHGWRHAYQNSGYWTQDRSESVEPSAPFLCLTSGRCFFIGFWKMSRLQKKVLRPVFFFCLCKNEKGRLAYPCTWSAGAERLTSATCHISKLRRLLCRAWSPFLSNVFSRDGFLNCTLVTLYTSAVFLYSAGRLCYIHIYVITYWEL